MGKMQRTKGAKGELEACKFLVDVFPSAARELEQYQGELGRDLRDTGDLCIQVKRHKTIAPGGIQAAYEEAVSAIDDTYKIPIVMYREDNKKWRVYTSFKYLFILAGMMDIDCMEADSHMMCDTDGKQFLNWYKEQC